MISDHDIKESMAILSQLSGDEEVVQLAEMREKAILDERSSISGAREEGKIESKIEDAINFLKLAIDYETVANGTGLSIEKIIELKKKI